MQVQAADSVSRPLRGGIAIELSYVLGCALVGAVARLMVASAAIACGLIVARL
jgi:hypothetical protein